MTEYEELVIPARHPQLERTNWSYRTTPNGGFRIRFSLWAWLLRKIHGPDATKVFWVWKKR